MTGNAWWTGCSPDPLAAPKAAWPSVNRSRNGSVHAFVRHSGWPAFETCLAGLRRTCPPARPVVLRASWLPKTIVGLGAARCRFIAAQGSRVERTAKQPNAACLGSFSARWLDGTRSNGHQRFSMEAPPEFQLELGQTLAGLFTLRSMTFAGVLDSPAPEQYKDTFEPLFLACELMCDRPPHYLRFGRLGVSWSGIGVGTPRPGRLQGADRPTQHAGAGSYGPRGDPQRRAG